MRWSLRSKAVVASERALVAKEFALGVFPIQQRCYCLSGTALPLVVNLPKVVETCGFWLDGSESAAITEAKPAGAGWTAAKGGAVAPKAASSAPKPPRGALQPQLRRTVGAQPEKTDQTALESGRLTFPVGCAEHQSGLRFRLGCLELCQPPDGAEPWIDGQERTVRGSRIESIRFGQFLLDASDPADPFGAFVSATGHSPAMFGVLGFDNPPAFPRFHPVPACGPCAAVHRHHHAMASVPLGPRSAAAHILPSAWGRGRCAFGPRASGSAP
jgi:hypothetical protein